MRRRTKILSAAAGVLSVALAGTGLMLNSANAATAPQYPVNYNFISGYYSHVFTYNTPPPGANVANCKPSAEHPYPVVLVHGTFENQSDNWQAAAPLLANAGYCVYTFNYGGSGPLAATGAIPQSAQELSAEVDKVLAQTGAAKVDIVGHSQGGMMPRYYLKFLNGASKVNMLVGLAPSNYGTTVSGLGTLENLFGLTSSVNAQAAFAQVQGSAFMKKLNSGGDTVPGVKFVVIETNKDEVVTPYTNAFLRDNNPDVTNVLLQKVCPADTHEHLSISYDKPALQMTLNALDGASDITAGVTCQ